MTHSDYKLGAERNPIALIDHTSEKEKGEKEKGKRGAFYPI